MHNSRPNTRRGEVTLGDLCIMVLLFVAILVGAVYGVRFASSYGVAAQVFGAIVGPIIAVVAVITTLLIVGVTILDPYERFCRWWRPHPPACENGTCSHESGYEYYELPDDVVRQWKGLSWLGQRCQCGFVYAGGYDYPLLNRWVRVLRDGTLRPYLVHRPLGRWQPDDPHTEVAVPKIDQVPTVNLPWWIVPVLMPIIFSGLAFAVVFRDLDTEPVAYPFVICCAALGGVIGTVTGLIVRRSDSMAKRTDRPVA